MRTVAYYRQQAAQCRRIAKQISLSEPRDNLMTMAAEWEQLADDREAELLRQGDSAAAPSGEATERAQDQKSTR